MHLPCGQAYGFGITAIITTPEDVLTGLIIKSFLQEFEVSRCLKISLFLGKVERQYFADASLTIFVILLRERSLLD